MCNSADRPARRGVPRALPDGQIASLERQQGNQAESLKPAAHKDLQRVICNHGVNSCNGKNNKDIREEGTSKLLIR